jgi:hypothetical protein
MIIEHMELKNAGKKSGGGGFFRLVDNELVTVNLRAKKYKKVEVLQKMKNAKYAFLPLRLNAKECCTQCPVGISNNEY